MGNGFRQSGSTSNRGAWTGAAAVRVETRQAPVQWKRFTLSHYIPILKAATAGSFSGASRAFGAGKRQTFQFCRQRDGMAAFQFDVVDLPDPDAIDNSTIRRCGCIRLANESDGETDADNYAGDADDPASIGHLRKAPSSHPLYSPFCRQAEGCRPPHLGFEAQTAGRSPAPPTELDAFIDS